MSIVIVGGNERMACQYEDIYLVILFTNTVSHKMVVCASQEAKKNNVPILHCHTSSATALNNLLAERKAEVVG